MNMKKIDLKQYNLKSNKVKLNTQPCESVQQDDRYSNNNNMFKSVYYQQIDMDKNCTGQDLKTLNSCQSPTFATQMLSLKTNQFKNLYENNNNRFIGDKKGSKDKTNIKFNEEDYLRLKKQHQNLVVKYQESRQKYDKLLSSKNLQPLNLTNEELLQKMRKQSFWKMYKQAEMMLKKQSSQIDSLSFLKQMQSLRVQAKQIKKNNKQLKTKKQQLQKQNTKQRLQIEQLKLRQQKLRAQKISEGESVSKQDIKKYTDQILKMKEKIHILQKQIEQQKQQNISDQILIKQHNKKRIQAQQKYKLSEQLNVKQRQNTSQLNIQVEKMKQKNHQLQKQIVKLEERLKRQTLNKAGQTTSLKQQLQDLQIQFNEKQKQIQKLKSQIALYKENQEKLYSKVEALNKNSSDLNTLVQNLNKQNNQLQQKFKQHHLRKEQQTRNILELEKQNKRLTQTISTFESSFKQKILTVQKNYNDLMIKYQNQSNSKVDLELQNKLLKQSLQQNIQIKQKIQNQVKTLQHKIIDLQEQIKQHQSSIPTIDQRQNKKGKQNLYSRLNNSKQLKAPRQKTTIQRRLYSKQDQQEQDYPQKTNKFSSFKVYQDTSSHRMIPSQKSSISRPTWSKIKQISSLLKQYLNQNRIRSKYFKNQTNSSYHNQYQDCYNISQQMSDRLLNQIQANILTLFDKLDHYKKDAQITQEVYLEIQDSKKLLQQKDTSIILKEQIIKTTLLFVPQKYKELFLEFIQLAQTIKQIDPYEYDEQSSIQENFNCLKTQIEQASEDWISQIKDLQKTLQTLQKENFVLQQNSSRQIKRNSNVNINANQFYPQKHQNYIRSNEKYRLSQIQKNKAKRRETVKQKYSFR